MRIWAGATAAVVLLAVLVATPIRNDRDICIAPLSDSNISSCTRVIEDSREIPKNRAFAFVKRADAYFNERSYDRAIADDSEAIQLYPSAAAYAHRARTYGLKGEDDRAMQDLGEAIRLNPRDPITYSSRAAIKLRRGEFDRAVVDAGEAIRIDPKFALTLAIRAAAYFGKGDLDHAVVDSTEAIRLDGTIAFAYATRGGAYLYMGDLDRALADASNAIQLDPENARLYANRAAIYSCKGEYTRSIADASGAIQRDPRFSDAYFGRGRANFYAGALAQALADFEEAITLTPKNSYLVLWLDIAERRSGRPSRLSQAAARIDPKLWPAPLIRLFLGQAMPGEVLAAAKSPEGSGSSRACEASFYVGEYALQRDETDVATQMFRTAANECPKSTFERAAAIAELRALDQAP